MWYLWNFLEKDTKPVEKIWADVLQIIYKPHAKKQKREKYDLIATMEAAWH